MPTGVYDRTPEMRANMSKGWLSSELSRAHLAAVSESNIGTTASTDHCKAISKGRLESDAVKTEAGRQRGGNDIVEHHYIYDHADPSKNIVRLSRSVHASLHNLFREYGIKVPHINESVSKWRYRK